MVPWDSHLLKFSCCSWTSRTFRGPSADVPRTLHVGWEDQRYMQVLLCYGGTKWAHKWLCECYQCFSWCKLNVIHGDQHSLQGQGFSKKVFRCKNLTLFTVTSIRESTENRSSETRWKATEIQSLSRSKDREIELTKKEAWSKRRE